MSNINAVTGTNPTDYAGRAGTPAANTPVTGASFSEALADALKEEMTMMTVTTGAGLAGMPGEYAPMQSQGLEQMILAAAASGETSDAQIALFMLCMMMQGDQGGDFSMLMQMMSTMLTQIQGDTEKLRSDVMRSDYDPYILDQIDRDVFNVLRPDGRLDGQVILPLEVWKPTTPVITSSEGDRSASLYRAVIDQFSVETAERYRPFRDGYTYCNIFMWDVTSAMGAEIPHYTNPQTGEPMYYPDIKGANQMGAIATDEWLKKYGPEYGWRQVDAETAQRYANEGKPAVTTAGSLGHVQIVCPSRDGDFDPVRGVTIAQAGRIVTNYTHLSGTYSTNGQQSVSYFVHD